VRTSISGPTRDHVSYAFDTTVITEKFSMFYHNPLNVGSITIALYRAMDMTFWLPQAEVVLAQVSR